MPVFPRNNRGMLGLVCYYVWWMRTLYRMNGSKSDEMAWCLFSLWLGSSNGLHRPSSIWMKIKPWIVKAKVSQHDFIYFFSYITKLKTLTLFLTENLIPKLRRLPTASPSKSLRKVKATWSIYCVSQSTPDSGPRTTMTQSSYAKMLLKSCEYMYLP